jgi:hypothetical protein
LMIQGCVASGNRQGGYNFSPKRAVLSCNIGLTGERR